uniref:Uncharacterized protein n=1 Tax=Bionectria ochroleuca TaxID=29856 RepID=A0A0B7KKE7_BIOOC
MRRGTEKRLHKVTPLAANTSISTSAEDIHQPRTRSRSLGATTRREGNITLHAKEHPMIIPSCPNC